ncbi:MAG: hypothetical protein GY832_04950 [Chloroflexi bacterium]|nr:hypothetical protein [Chloroflexota bacterium]
MCHTFLSDSRFYRFLFQIDLNIATEVQAGGCIHCGGSLHVSCYPRKPRGIRSILDESYDYRLSFCCSKDGCRRRNTPPSVRFCGRKVYLGVIVVLICAMEHGLTSKRRKQLIEELDIWPQTISRWRKWWREVFPVSRCWRSQKGNFMPPIEFGGLPGKLLGRLNGKNLPLRLCQLLLLLAPFTTTSWSGSLRVVIDPQKM